MLKLKVDLLATLAQKGTFTRTSAGFCLTELVDKLGDLKNGAATQEALSCIAEGISLNYIGGEVSHVIVLCTRRNVYYFCPVPFNVKQHQYGFEQIIVQLAQKCPFEFDVSFKLMRISCTC